jgi:hypothetical protein
MLGVSMSDCSPSRFTKSRVVEAGARAGDEVHLCSALLPEGRLVRRNAR